MRARKDTAASHYPRPSHTRSIASLCRELDELFLLPTQSKTTSYSIIPGEEGRPSQIDLLVHRDGSRFSFPVDDVALLPLENSTVEELSRLLAGRIAERMGHEALKSRYVTSLTVGIAESPGQEAAFTLDLRPQLAANPTSQ